MEWFKIQTVWGSSVERLSDAEAGRFVKALFAYADRNEEFAGSNGREDPITWMALDSLRKDIESFRKSESDFIAHKQAISEKRRAAARSRWMQTDANACKSKQMHANASNCMQMHDFASPTPPLEEEREVLKENPLKGVKEKRDRFSPPTVEMVAEYCRERKNGVDPQHFVDFYASKGWKVGNQPMKDWKACVRTWEKRDNITPMKSDKSTGWNYAQRSYSEDELESRTDAI
jgi:hypothetical protein